MAIGHDGVDDRINAATLVNFLSMPLTISTLFRLDVLTTEMSLGGVTADDGDYHVLNLLGNLAGDPIGARSLNSGVNSAQGVSGSTGAAINTWYHAAGVHASATSRTAWFEGSAGTTETTNVSNAAMSSVTPGPFTSFIDGNLASWGAYKVALSGDDQNALVKRFPPSRVRPQELVAYFDLVRDTKQRMSACGQPSSVVGTFVADHPRSYGF
jgi:hypothetical protein